MTDPERSKGRKKGSTEVRKKGKKVQSDNTVNEPEAPDTLICNRCKGIFTNVNAKMTCCDRCQKWYCTKCVNITDALYSFLASKEADDIAWFCKACKCYVFFLGFCSPIWYRLSFNKLSPKVLNF